MLLGPVAYVGSLLVPALQSNELWNKTVVRHERWLVMATDPTTSVTLLTVEARGIWLDITRAYFFDSITFAGEFMMRIAA